MHFPKKIIFLFLVVISFSCKTRLEKQGWQRIPIVSQVDTATIRKDKELVVEKINYKNSPVYQFYIYQSDSAGRIICKGRARGGFPNSDIAYYKMESDSVCLVKLLNQGNVQVSLKIGFGYWSGLLDVVYEPKASQLEQRGLQGTAIISRADTSGMKNGKELIVERLDLNGKYDYSLTVVEKDPTGKLINKPGFGFEKSFKSDMAYYKWESDSLCIIRLMSHGKVQDSLKYIEHSDSTASFEFLNDLKQ